MPPRLTRREKKNRVGELLTFEQLWYQVFLLVRDGQPANSFDVPVFEEKLKLNPNYRYQPKPRLTVRMQKIRRKSWPPDRKIWASLVRAETPEHVRQACKRWMQWLRPGLGLQPFPEQLAKNAEEFLRIKKDHRYPRSLRPSSDQKRLDHFARGMAGVDVHISPITAIDLLRRIKHGLRCKCWRCENKRLEEAMRYLPKEIEMRLEHVATVEVKPGGTVRVPLLASVKEVKDELRTEMK